MTCKVYTGYHATIEVEHGLSACTFDSPLAKAGELSLSTGGQSCSILHMYAVIKLKLFKFCAYSLKYRP